MLLAYLFITWAVKPEGMSLPGPASSGALRWWPGVCGSKQGRGRCWHGHRNGGVFSKDSHRCGWRGRCPTDQREPVNRKEGVCVSEIEIETQKGWGEKCVRGERGVNNSEISTGYKKCLETNE